MVFVSVAVAAEDPRPQATAVLAADGRAILPVPESTRGVVQMIQRLLRREGDRRRW
jgi:hypothetical protein